jgi:hypothetical protein
VPDAAVGYRSASLAATGAETFPAGLHPSHDHKLDFGQGDYGMNAKTIMIASAAAMLLISGSVTARA